MLLYVDDKLASIKSILSNYENNSCINHLLSIIQIYFEYLLCQALLAIARSWIVSLPPKYVEVQAHVQHEMWPYLELGCLEVLSSEAEVIRVGPIPYDRCPSDTGTHKKEDGRDRTDVREQT